MKPKTEELLHFLSWSVDMLMQPTFRNLNEGYESWAYRNGLFRQVSRLESRMLIERDSGPSDVRLYRLTEAGRLQAIGGRDPEKAWSRHWDGQWRMAFFDVPITENSLRDRLTRYLRNKAFGCLQRSVWITPDPLAEERQLLKGAKVTGHSLIFMEGRPCAGESDEAIVRAAWDFPIINRRYEEYLKILEGRPRGALHGSSSAKALQRWAAKERSAWLDAVSIDPLLPSGLLPPDYLGRKAWSARQRAASRIGQQLSTFTT